MKQIACTQKELDLVRSEAAYYGYSMLDDRQKQIADAFDGGTLKIVR